FDGLALADEGGALLDAPFFGGADEPACVRGRKEFQELESGRHLVPPQRLHVRDATGVPYASAPECRGTTALRARRGGRTTGHVPMLCQRGKTYLKRMGFVNARGVAPSRCRCVIGRDPRATAITQSPASSRAVSFSSRRTTPDRNGPRHSLRI